MKEATKKLASEDWQCSNNYKKESKTHLSQCELAKLQKEKSLLKASPIMTIATTEASPSLLWHITITKTFIHPSIITRDEVLALQLIRLQPKELAIEEWDFNILSQQPSRELYAML